jgi:hypothetical protein
MMKHVCRFTCTRFRDFLEIDPAVLQTLVNQYPEALGAETEREKLNPVMAAVSSIDAPVEPGQEDSAAVVLTRMIWLAPSSLSCVSHMLDAYITLLNTACWQFPHVRLLSDVVEA